MKATARNPGIRLSRFGLKIKPHFLLAGVVAKTGQRNSRCQDTMRLQTKTLLLDVLKAPEQQSRSGDQNHADGDLPNHEASPQQSSFAEVDGASGEGQGTGLLQGRQQSEYPSA